MTELCNKKRRLVFDAEANGLLKEVTEVHCLVFRDVDTDETIELYGSSLNREAILEIVDQCDILIGHNIIEYDIPLIKKFFNVSIINKLEIIDTLVWSKCLYPDRPLPKGCPTSLYNPVTEKSQRVTNHGLEAWGWRVGSHKPAIHDWRCFNEEMLHRCVEDTKINSLVYKKLCKEAELEELIPITFKPWRMNT